MTPRKSATPIPQIPSSSVIVIACCNLALPVLQRASDQSNWTSIGILAYSISFAAIIRLITPD
jgi:hypothetical protein